MEFIYLIQGFWDKDGHPETVADAGRKHFFESVRSADQYTELGPKSGHPRPDTDQRINDFKNIPSS